MQKVRENIVFPSRALPKKTAFKKASSEYDRNLLAFYVKNKWFCFFNVNEFDFRTLKFDPEESKKLQEKYEDVTAAYHMNKKHWINVYFNKEVSDKVIKDLLKNSYELVVASLTKRIRQDLEEDARENG